MALPIIALAAVAAVVAGNAAYDYLFPDNELPQVNPTNPSPESIYIPPFIGGQCVGANYQVLVEGTFNTGELVYSWGFNQSPTIAGLQVQRRNVVGRITSVSISAPNNFGTVVYSINGIPQREIVRNTFGQFVNSIKIIQIIRTDGIDNCGNLPNPLGNNAPPIGGGGIPSNSTPVITPSDEIVNAGLPVVFAPSALSALAGLAAQLGAAIANAAAAADALAAIKATADAVDKLAKMLDRYKDLFEQLRKYLNKQEKEDDAKKRYLIRRYGTILRDGYLDITPRPAPDGFDPIMLDFLCANVPSGLGRFFGDKSYNWFRYNELGSICFLSPTFGVLSVHKIEHVRTSIAIPELAVGFTYNMGLNGVIRARVSMLYTQEKTNTEP